MQSEFDQGDTDQDVDVDVQELTAEMQRALDDVHAQHQGEPVEAVKAALEERLAQINGADLDEPELTELAEHISAGDRIDLELDPR